MAWLSWKTSNRYSWWEEQTSKTRLESYLKLWGRLYHEKYQSLFPPLSTRAISTYYFFWYYFIQYTSGKLKKFRSIRKVEGRLNSSKTKKFQSGKSKACRTVWRLSRLWRVRKIQVDPESRRPVKRTVQRWPRVSEKTSFERRLGTLENVFDREMKSESMQSQPRLRRVRRRPWVSEKTSFPIRFHFREDRVFVQEMKGECIRTYYATWLAI